MYLLLFLWKKSAGCCLFIVLTLKCGIFTAFFTNVFGSMNSSLLFLLSLLYDPMHSRQKYFLLTYSQFSAFMLEIYRNITFEASKLHNWLVEFFDSKSINSSHVLFFLLLLDSFVKVQLYRYVNNILHKWSLVKISQVFCVSCAALNIFPLNLSFIWT